MFKQLVIQILNHRKEIIYNSIIYYKINTTVVAKEVESHFKSSILDFNEEVRDIY